MKKEKTSISLDGELFLPEIQTLNETPHRVIFEDETGLFSGQILPTGKIFLHLKAKLESFKFTKTLLKEWRAQFIEFLEVCKSNGHSYVYIMIDAKDEKLLKFETLFGFQISQIVYSLEGEPIYWIMKRETM